MPKRDGDILQGNLFSPRIKADRHGCANAQPNEQIIVRTRRQIAAAIRHRLVGAYQGIALGEAQRSAARHGAGPVRELVSRYEQGYVILQPLKDGYYLALPRTTTSAGVVFTCSAVDPVTVFMLAATINKERRFPNHRPK